MEIHSSVFQQEFIPHWKNRRSWSLQAFWKSWKKKPESSAVPPPAFSFPCILKWCSCSSNRRQSEIPRWGLSHPRVVSLIGASQAQFFSPMDTIAISCFLGQVATRFQFRESLGMSSVFSCNSHATRADVHVFAWGAKHMHRYRAASLGTEWIVWKQSSCGHSRNCQRF